MDFPFSPRATKVKRVENDEKLSSNFSELLEPSHCARDFSPFNAFGRDSCGHIISKRRPPFDVRKA